MPVLQTIITLVRNIANLTRIGGPQGTVVPSVDGQPMQNEVIGFLNAFEKARLSTKESRLELGQNATHPIARGQRFDFDAWLRSTSILLKIAQTQAIGSRKVQLNIVSRYLMNEGCRWYSPTGLGEEQLTSMRKTNRIQKLILLPSFTLRTTALAIPADLEEKALKEQLAFLRSLGSSAKVLYEPLTDNLLPAEALWLLYDFSLHTDAELMKLLAAIRPFRQETLGDRVRGFAADLYRSFVEIEDLLHDELSQQSFQTYVDKVAIAIDEKRPAVSVGQHSTNLSGMVLPKDHTKKKTPL